MKALISVYDRTGAVEFAGKLIEAGFEIISTGGTRAELTSAGLPVTLLSDVTGFPEVLDARRCIGEHRHRRAYDDPRRREEFSLGYRHRRSQ